MYQTVGHHAIDLYAEAMELPLYRRTIVGSSVSQGKVYEMTATDEVEDLYLLLKQVKVSIVLGDTHKKYLGMNYSKIGVSLLLTTVLSSSLF